MKRTYIIPVLVILGQICGFFAGYCFSVTRQTSTKPDQLIVHNEGKIIGIEDLGKKDQITITGQELHEIIGWSFRQGFDAKKQFDETIKKTKLEIQEQKWKAKAPEIL